MLLVSIGFLISVRNTVEPLGTDTSPVYYGQFPMSRQNSHIFSLKNKIQKQKKNLCNTNPDQVNPHMVNPV